jgi:hypothetical protein
LAVGIFIDDTTTIGPLSKERRGYPGLQNKPAAEIDTTNFAAVVVKAKTLPFVTVQNVRKLANEQGSLSVHSNCPSRS